MILFLFFAAWAGCSAKGEAAYSEDMAQGFSRRSAAGAAAPIQENAVMFKDMSSLYGTGFNPTRPPEDAVPPEESVPAAPAETEAGAERKLVRQARINIRVQDPEKAEDAVAGIMEKYGAYAASTAIDDNSRQFTIRVPSASYRVLLADIGGLGRVIFRSENAEDVTVRYYDLEGRLATKRELLKTFRSYLEKAKTIEEILSVERRIAELEDEIDGTGRELRTLGNLVDYATVELEVHGPVTISSHKTPTLGDRLLGLLDSFGNFASTLALVLVGIVIFGIPLMLIFTVLFWVLFGKIGLLKKLWRVAAGKKTV